MEKIFESSKKIFIEKNKEKIASYYYIATKHTNYLDNCDNVEELYYLLKQIRDTSAILNLSDLFNVVSHLLRHFRITGLKYELADDKKNILLDGLRILLKYFFSYESDNDEIKLSKNIDISLLNDEMIKILIIDDDEIFVDWLRDSLMGTEFCLYSDNIENLKGYLLKGNIAIMLINTTLPKSFEIIEDIKSHAWTIHIPIYAVTHTKDEAELNKILKYNVEDIIIKPFSINLFLAKLRNYFNRNKILSKSDLLSSKFQRIEMTELIKKEWVRFQRFNSYYSILILKLDMYGRLLDTYGHERVFEYLTLLYQSINKSIRTYDEVKLWNSDSLLVLLPATRVDGAIMVAKRIKELANNLDLDFLSKYLLIGTVESDHDYQGALDMVSRLERELITTSSEIIVPESLSQRKITKVDLRKKVLIIDDDSATLTIMGNHFKSDEWIIEELTDGTKALDKALELRPDFIIAETRSKNFDGYDFCYQVRQFPTLRDTIFFFLSKQTLNKNIVRGIKLGADDYITKPFSPEEVEVRIIRHWTNLNYRRG